MCTAGSGSSSSLLLRLVKSTRSVVVGHPRGARSASEDDAAQGEESSSPLRLQRSAWRATTTRHSTGLDDVALVVGVLLLLQNRQTRSSELAALD